MTEVFVGILNMTDGAANLGGMGKGEGDMSKPLKSEADAFDNPGDCGGVSKVDFPWNVSVGVLVSGTT